MNNENIDFKKLTDFNSFNLKKIKMIQKFHEVRDEIEFNLNVRTNLSCNFKCSYCYVRTNLNQDKNYLNPKIFNKWVNFIIKNIQDYQVFLYKRKIFKKVMLDMSLLGGETFILKNDIIDQYLSVLNKYPDITRINILTNGYFIDKMIYFMNKYEKNNLNYYISFHQEQISFNKFYNKLKKLKNNINENLIKNIKVAFLSNDPESLKEEFKAVKELGIDVEINELYYYSYFDFFSKNKINRVCHALTFNLKYDDPLYIYHKCYPDQKIRLIDKKINFKKYIFNCNKACTCAKDELWIYKEKYFIKD